MANTATRAEHASLDDDGLLWQCLVRNLDWYVTQTILKKEAVANGNVFFHFSKLKHQQHCQCRCEYILYILLISCMVLCIVNTCRCVHPFALIASMIQCFFETSGLRSGWVDFSRNFLDRIFTLPAFIGR